MLLRLFSKTTACSGFTRLELIITCCIVGILASTAVPVFSSLVPDYRLRSAVQELYANMHFAKMRAIKENRTCRIEFFTGECGYYTITDSDNTIIKTIDLCGADSDCTINYGCGNAVKGATTLGGSAPLDGISYNSNKAAFNSMGRGSQGYVYLENNRGNSYAIGTWTSGIIVIKKWDEKSHLWK